MGYMYAVFVFAICVAIGLCVPKKIELNQATEFTLLKEDDSQSLDLFINSTVYHGRKKYLLLEVDTDAEAVPMLSVYTVQSNKG